jgi:2-aminoadipate transaminase
MTILVPAHTARQTEPASPLASSLVPWLRQRERSLLRRMVATVSAPGIRSLAGGLPDPALFPSAEIGEALREAIRDDPRALQYSPAQEALQERVVLLMRRRGVACRPENVLLTSGAQQGIDLATRALLLRGGAVAMEEMTYPGAAHAVAPFEPRVLAVRGDLEGGLDVDHLEWLLRSGPKPAFLYLVPDAHNPLGLSLASDRRRAVCELARRYAFAIVEDDPYGLLAYDGAFPPPLHAIDPDNVVYLGSFSKILAPGLRLGWLVAPADAVQRLRTLKEGIDLETSGLVQRAVARLLQREGWIDSHLTRLCDVYRSRRDALLGALSRRLEGRASWTRPGGGMFVWVELAAPENRTPPDTEELLRVCLERRSVAFLPGRAFAATPGDPETRGRRSLRLSFSSLPAEELGEAVDAVADCLAAYDASESGGWPESKK